MDRDLYHEGLAWKQEGNVLEALKAFEQAVDETPESAEVWNEIGLLYDDDGRASAAAKCYEKAIGLNPHCAKAWNNWGVSFFLREDYREAETRFKEALRLDPALESARLNLADTHEALGEG